MNKMVLELILITISEILAFYVAVCTILSYIKSSIGDNAYNIYFSKYENLIKLTFFLIVLFIIVINAIKRNYIIIKYRFRNNPRYFDLFKKDIINRQSEIITFRLKKSNDSSIWMYILNKLNFTLFIVFKCPLGTTLGRERETELINGNFRFRTEKSQSLSYTLPLYANGTREISINVSIRDDIGFVGNEPINIKTYIAFNFPILRNLLKLEVGHDSIDINTSC